MMRQVRQPAVSWVQNRSFRDGHHSGQSHGL